MMSNDGLIVENMDLSHIHFALLPIILNLIFLKLTKMLFVVFAITISLSILQTLTFWYLHIIKITDFQQFFEMISNLKEV